MNYKTHNQEPIETASTFFLDEITVKYSKLKKVFGRPLEGDGYKSEAEWQIKFDDGKIGTIYDYKVGKHYKPEFGLSK